jgi:hypothetical protein
MIDELVAETEIYTAIAAAFPLMSGCDTIECRLGKMK